MTYFAVIGRNDELLFEYANFGSLSASDLEELQIIALGALDVVDAAVSATGNHFVDAGWTTGRSIRYQTTVYIPFGELRYVTIFQVQGMIAHQRACREAHALLRAYRCNPFSDFTRPLWNRRGEEPAIHRELTNSCVKLLGGNRAWYKSMSS